MEKVIPPGLNYADIKPEAIENQIRMIKFLPLSNVQNQRPNDVVRFHLQGNGFYDPYSAYIKIRVAYDMNQIKDPTSVDDCWEIENYPSPDGEFISGAFLDRSAHSLINRLVIKSQGTELERIEHYDVLAAMINDMVYNNDQRELHSFEGFACNQFQMNSTNWNSDPVAKQFAAFAAVQSESEPEVCNHFGDRGFFKLRLDQFKRPISVYESDAKNLRFESRFNRMQSMATDLGHYFMGTQAGVPFTFNDAGLTTLQAEGDFTPKDVSDAKYNYTATTTAGYAPIGKEGNPTAAAEKKYARVSGILTSPGVMEFCIPIYSGIIGVLMPDKKLLPLSLLPLEVEFTLNPHAFYTVGNTSTRSAYTIQTFEIWTHTLFFEQELHRSLETVVAENGIFLHYTSFYLTPINSYNSNVIPKYHQLGCFLKSVEAIHWVFLYQDFYNDDGPKKLHFASHNLYNLQLRNGMDLIPSEPIPAAQTRGSIGKDVVVGASNQLMIELMKAWNKMHDVFSSGSINSFNFNIDSHSSQEKKPLKLNQLIDQFKTTGRAQYGLSLVGEEIGQNKTIISGKKTVLPFDLNFDGSKARNSPSIMLSYLRADFIVYVRPDLVVTRLGL